ncbi:RNA polymerase subunit sigma-70 [Siphonobacter sp. BAB-5405]|nr:RNA polymerase subunit sigma-70 [Siphonobacter sp. BAB-5405]
MLIQIQSPHTDESLIALLKQDDRSAFELLYRKYWRRLYDSAYRRVQTREDCEEIVQELFLDLWSKRQHLEITTSLEIYLFTALRYRIYNYIRSLLTKKAHLDYLLQRGDYEANLVEDQLYYEELQRALDAGVAQLPEKYRRVYELSRQEHYTYREIAQLLELPIDTVEKQMAKALKLLRLHLKEHLFMLLLAAHLLG